jgi:hypothetical protein
MKIHNSEGIDSGISDMKASNTILTPNEPLKFRIFDFAVE